MATIGRIIHPIDDALISSQADLMIATKDWLESVQSGEWLLIIDGANDCTPEYMGYIEQFIPHKRGIVVFTSTTKQIISTVGSPDYAVEIEPMNFTDAQELFRKVSGIAPGDEKTMEKLLEHLEYLPLAITQAASYVRTREISIERYLEMIEDAEGHLFHPSSADPPDYTAAESRSTMTTFLVTLSHVEEMSPKAALLLQLMSLLGANIAVSVLKALQSKQLILSSDRDLHDAIGLLLSYHLVVKSHSNHFREDTYRVHRLIARHALTNMQTKKLHLCSIALSAAEHWFPDPKASTRNVKVCIALTQHAEAILAHSKEFEELKDQREQLKSRTKLAKYYAYEHKKDKARVLSSRIQRNASQRTLMLEGLDYDWTTT
jgi:hypothetical protein